MGFISFFRKLFGGKQSNENSNEVKVKVSTSQKINISTGDINPIYLQPLSNGLLPGEVLLIHWVDGRPSNTHFPKYFSYTYGLHPEKSVAKLLKKGFMTEADPVDALKSLKVVELKEILRENELKVSGRKQELIDRIGEHLPEAEIDTYIQHKPLTMTSKGKQTLDHYYYIVPAHVNSSQDGIYNVATAIEYVNEVGGTPNNSDISWALYERASMKYFKDQSYGLFRNVILNMAQQLQREKNLKGALNSFLKVFIIDLSGLSNGGILSKPDSVIVAPGILNYIQNLLETLELDEKKTRQLFDTAWENIINSLPFHYLDQETCYECFLAALNENDEFIEKQLDQSYESLDKTTFEKEYSLKIMF